MRDINLEELNKIRKYGYRPGVVCCIINEQRLLLVYKRDYGLWLIPQGGIENKESVSGAVKREIKDELGDLVLDFCDDNYNYVGEGDIEFSSTSRGVKELKTDEGEPIDMKGKRYFFFVIACSEDKLNFGKSVFDDHTWANYQQAEFLLSKNYQANKRDLTLNAIKQLGELGVLK